MHPVQNPARSRFPQHSAMYGSSSENDAIVHSPVAVSQQFRTAERSNESSSSTPLFQHMYRRKRDNSHRYDFPSQRKRKDHFYTNLVQTAMKGILLSPVIVLVVWSVTAISWTNQQLSMRKFSSGTTQRQQNQPSMAAVPSNGRRGWVFGRRRTQQPPQPQATGPHIVQPLYLQEPMQGLVEDFDPVSVPFVASTPNSAQNLVLTSPEMASSGKKQYYYSFPEQQQTPQMVTGDVATGALPQVVALNDPATGKTQYYYTFPEQGKAKGVIVANTNVQNPVVMMAEGSDAVDSPLGGDAMTVVQEEAAAQLMAQASQQSEPTLRTMSRQQASHSNVVRNSKNSHPSHGKQNTRNIQYYFYDPKNTKKDQHGHLRIPQFVYDTYGRVISVNSLAKTMASPILMQEEPNGEPILTMIHQNATTLNATQYNYTHTHPPVVETRQKRKMSHPNQFLSTAKTNNDSSSTTDDDSSMIICTVGVMALFVGALSARRLRHQRSILSVCIENETLDEDAAYDAAYTTTNPNAFASHYNTFAQGWKGDLEKFDV